MHLTVQGKAITLCIQAGLPVWDKARLPIALPLTFLLMTVLEQHAVDRQKVATDTLAGVTGRRAAFHSDPL